MKKIIVVDEAHCTGCGLCEELALENIEVPLRTDLAVVTRQPSTRQEWIGCLEAVRECPSQGLSVQDAVPEHDSDRDSDRDSDNDSSNDSVNDPGHCPAEELIQRKP